MEPVPEHQLLTEEDQDSHQRIVKAEPVTASQQISLWLMRASTQDIYQELGAMGSFRNIFRNRTDSLKPGVLRKCETDVQFRIESDQEEDFEQNESPRKSVRKMRSKIKSRGSKNQSNDSLLKHFSIKGKSHTVCRFLKNI